MQQTILWLGFPSLLVHTKQFTIFQMCAGFVSFSLWAMPALPKESKISITVSCGGGRWIRKSVNQFGGTDNIYYALEMQCCTWDFQ